MYAEHVPLIAEHARRDAQGLADVLTFALVTIRLPFMRVPGALQEVRQRGLDAGALWGNKRLGAAYIVAHGAELYRDAMALDDPETTAELVDLFAHRVPGLAIVKSAFVAQMLGHDVACFDTRNLQALGFDMDARPFREFRTRNGICVTRPETRLRRIADYIARTRATGGAEHWWNKWCNDVAERQGGEGNHISAIHLREISKGCGIRPVE